MRRGEIWTASGGPDYVGKPHPVVIVQDDRFHAAASITVVLFTIEPAYASLFHPAIEPTRTNGLQSVPRLMADKITTVVRTRLGSRVGRLAPEETRQLDRALSPFLGLAR